MLRASSEVFASALRDSTGRGDEAVAKRERTSAYLEQCEESLRARDDELAQSQRELRELRAVLRESQPTLTRTPRGLRTACTGYAYQPPAFCAHLRHKAACPGRGRGATVRTPYTYQPRARRWYRTAYCAVHRRSQDELVRVEAFIGGAKMEEAKRRRGWLRAFLK